MVLDYDTERKVFISIETKEIVTKPTEQDKQDTLQYLGKQGFYKNTFVYQEMVKDFDKALNS